MAGPWRWARRALPTLLALRDCRAAAGIDPAGEAEVGAGAGAWRARRLWVDADPSGLVWTGLDCDDDLALLAALALNASGEVRLEGLGLCGGNAPLVHVQEDARLLLGSTAGAGSLRPAVGAGWRSMQPALAPLRFLSRWIPDVEDSDEAAEAIIAAAAEGPPRSLTVLTLGPPTNLARALAKAPWLGRRLQQAVLMGGELTGRRLDLNFMSDREAARAVLEEPKLPTTIVPVQTCAQVTMTVAFVDRLEAACCPGSAACALLPKMRQQTFLMPRLVNPRAATKMPPGGRWPPSAGLGQGFIPWDVVALLAAVRPALFEEWEYLAVAVPPCEAGEPCNGTMAASPVATAQGSRGWRGISRVPHRLRGGEGPLLEAALDLFCAATAVGGAGAAPPHLLPGFLGPLAALALAALGLLAAALWLCLRLLLRPACRALGGRRAARAKEA